MRSLCGYSVKSMPMSLSLHALFQSAFADSVPAGLPELLRRLLGKGFQFLVDLPGNHSGVLETELLAVVGHALLPTHHLHEVAAVPAVDVHLRRRQVHPLAAFRIEPV